MPKMKTNRAASKRVWKTGRGRLRRAHAGLSHLMRGKPDNRRRHLRHNTLVDKRDERRMQRLIPYKK